MKALRTMLILSLLAALTGVPAAAQSPGDPPVLVPSDAPDGAPSDAPDGAPSGAPTGAPEGFPNGDALFIGVPFEDIFSLADVGVVHALYAQPGGLSSAGSQIWTQESDGVPGSAGANETFGSTLASGDFNADGYPDLAIGAPTESTPTSQAYGAVYVLYGQAGGLTGAGSQFWRQGENGLADTYESPDHFGAALAAGDFNYDGYSDLAIGVPYESFPEAGSAGAVHILYGSEAGLTGSGSLMILDLGGPNPDSLLGSTLAALDYNCDHYVDLAVGAPAESYVLLYRSSPGGFTITVAMMWDGCFGASLAVGDFNGDTCDDLAIGAPDKSVDDTLNAGRVIVKMDMDKDSPWWISQSWNQNLLGPGSAAEENDHFGNSLAAGDFNNDGRADLAIGSRGEDNYRGAVHVLYSSNSGPSAAGSQVWTLDSPGIPRDSYWDDYFGDALAAGYFNADTYADLAISADGHFVGTSLHAGAVSVIYGSPLGLDASLTAPAQTWTQESAGLGAIPEENDYFGQAIASSFCPACRTPDQLIYLPLVTMP